MKARAVMRAPRLQSSRLALGALIGAAFVMLGCTRPAETTTAQGENEGEAVNSCGLLTAEEINAVQQSPVTGSQGSEQPDPIFQVTQCVYTAADPNRSVSLTVTRDRKPAGDRKVKDWWKDTFGRYEGEAQEKTGEAPDQGKDEDGERAPPTKIAGVGEAAYWVGYQFGGALYVLNQGALIRLSLGGPDSAEAKIEKTKALARNVISRL